MLILRFLPCPCCLHMYRLHIRLWTWTFDLDRGHSVSVYEQVTFSHLLHNLYWRNCFVIILCECTEKQICIRSHFVIFKSVFVLSRTLVWMTFPSTELVALLAVNQHSLSSSGSVHYIVVYLCFGCQMVWDCSLFLFIYFGVWNCCFHLKCCPCWT